MQAAAKHYGMNLGASPANPTVTDSAQPSSSPTSASCVRVCHLNRALACAGLCALFGALQFMCLLFSQPRWYSPPPSLSLFISLTVPLAPISVRPSLRRSIRHSGLRGVLASFAAALHLLDAQGQRPILSLAGNAAGTSTKAHARTRARARGSASRSRL